MTTAHPRILQRIAGRFSRIALGVSAFCQRSASYFYWLYAGILSVVITLMTLMNLGVGKIDPGTFDTVMQMRWTSPAAAKDIVILDVDEKSLAEMAVQYGRWPWQRDVFAQALAELEFEEAKSIIFTILVTDPDRDHPESDATLSFVASESYVTVYPVVRLPKEKDQYSKLQVCDLVPAGIMRCSGDTTIAAILPALPGMQHDLGIMNHHLDSDGILRHWSLLWEEPTWKMPTVISGALALAQIEPRVDPKTPYILNWRSDSNPYTTISFSDYIASLEGESRIEPGFFKDKHVIIAASARGLTVQKPTAMGVLDDGDILATALDDAINGTNLIPSPTWVVSLLAVSFVWALAALFVYGGSIRNLDGLFVGIEVAAVAIMALTINYTNHFIDLTPMAKLGLVFYSVSRIHFMLGSKVVMGSTAYIKRLAETHHFNTVGMIAFKNNKNKFMPQRHDKVRLQKACESGHIFFCRDVFQKNQLFEGINHVCCVVVLAHADDQQQIMDKLQDYLKQRGLQESVVMTVDIPDAVKRDGTQISQFIGLNTLHAISQLSAHG